MLLLMLSFRVYPEELSVDVRCFSSPNKNINLEVRLYTDDKIGWIGGQVRYKQSKEFIPLVFQKTETIREVEDRPWEFKHTWLEIVNGKINGQYVFVSQGALTYDFTYINKHSGKSVDLSKFTPPNKNGVCVWK